MVEDVLFSAKIRNFAGSAKFFASVCGSALLRAADDAAGQQVVRQRHRLPPPAVPRRLCRASDFLLRPFAAALPGCGFPEKRGERHGAESDKNFAGKVGYSRKKGLSLYA